jgi:hypothetical protein
MARTLFSNLMLEKSAANDLFVDRSGPFLHAKVLSGAATREYILKSKDGNPCGKEPQPARLHSPEEVVWRN